MLGVTVGVDVITFLERGGIFPNEEHQIQQI